MHYTYFDTARKGNNSSFLTPTVVGGDAPYRLKFALKVAHPFKKTPTMFTRSEVMVLTNTHTQTHKQTDGAENIQRSSLRYDVG